MPRRAQIQSEAALARRTKLDPRKLPQQLRSRETVNAIFEAAVQILEKREQEDPSVHAIAERAGVSVGSLYQYFPSKDALVGAIIRFHLQQRLGVLREEVAAVSGLSAEAAARRLIDGFVDGMAARSALERAVLQHFCRAGDLFTLTQVDDEMNAVVAEFIRSLGAQARPVDPDLAAFLVSNTLRSAVLLSIIQKPERLAQPNFKEELVRMIVGYLRPQ